MLESVAAVLLLVAAGLAGWYLHRPPPPWEFRGEIADRQTRVPIAGFEVAVEGGAGEKHSVYTDGQIRVCSSAAAVAGAAHKPLESTSKPFDTDMAKLL